MKKFLFCLFGFIGIYVLFDFAYYRWGFYLPNEKEIEIISFTDANEILMKENDQYKKVTVKGVNIGGSIPGKYVTDYAISYETYYRWLEQIAQMGSNTVRLNTIFGSEFYNAFYDYNENHEEKLYLIQGINLESYNLNATFDGYDAKFYGELVTQAKNAVDVVHGRKKMLLTNHGKGIYKKDISSYVLAYIIGSEWIDDTILYTNNSQETQEYDGKFLKSTKDATPFEIMLTKVMDRLITYETQKYQMQHSISFINTPETDPVATIPEIAIDEEQDIEYILPETLKYYYHKIVKLDLEHMETKNDYRGLFAAYNVSSYYPNYLSYELEEYQDTYLSYLERLTKYHKVPVLITEFAYSTSRGISSLSQDKYGNLGGMTEEEQGTSLLEAYKTILKSGCVGGMIATWQDEWDKRSWNTLEKIDTTKSINWSDAQTTNQGLGILTFDPGKEKSVCYVDGNHEEWSKENIILETKDVNLSVKQDEKYLYLYLQKKKASNTIYIPFDITNKSGTKKANKENLQFDRDVDFLLIINGDKGDLFVQDYYNVLKAVDGYELNNKNSYVHHPNKDSDNFEEIELLIEPYGTNIFSHNYKNALTVNTGALTYGNANPNDNNYNSQADYYENNGNVEIRLPWQILNFSDPSNNKIHDDYYENYGVDSYKIEEIYIGASLSGDQMIELKPYKLLSWNNNVTYHERLKKSYDIIKNSWRKME